MPGSAFSRTPPSRSLPCGQSTSRAYICGVIDERVRSPPSGLLGLRSAFQHLETLPTSEDQSAIPGSGRSGSYSRSMFNHRSILGRGAPQDGYTVRACSTSATTFAIELGSNGEVRSALQTSSSNAVLPPRRQRAG